MSNARNLSKLLGTDTQITTPDIADGVFQANKNLIINGAMQVAQRGTSATSQTTSAYLVLDRWRTEASGSTYNVSQQEMSSADLQATGFINFLRMEVTTGNNNAGVAQKIEASSIRQFKGQTLTASFYAKGTNPNGGSFTLSRFFYDGSLGSTAEESSFSVTSDWARYIITFDYPSEDSTDLTTSSAYMSLSFLQPAGDTSTNAWTLDITGIQLELGSTATPFEHRSYGEELSLCGRYYQKWADVNWILGVEGTRNTKLPFQFSTLMRANPTCAISGGSAANGVLAGTGVVDPKKEMVSLHFWRGVSGALVNATFSGYTLTADAEL
jgi:hypothetical protein